MANDSKDYLIPFGINPTGFFKAINDMDAGMDQLEQNAVSANKSLQTAFDTSSKAGQKLNETIQADSRAVQLLRDQAQKFGASIADALSGKGVGEQFKIKVDEIKKKLGSLTNTAVAVNVDFDAAKINVLQDQIKKAAGATAEFNTVIAFAKEQLAQLEPGQNFTTLQGQIRDAEQLVQDLNNALLNTGQAATIATAEFDRLFGNPGEFLTKAEILQLDETISKATTDSAALTAQVTALGQKLQTLTPGTAKFTQFQEAVNAGNAALAAMGAETVEFGAQQEAATVKTTSLRAQLRLMREELAQLEISGQTGSARFNELSIAAGNLADQVGDTGQRIKVLASDTKYLDAGIQAITGLTGAFTAAQGAAALLGDDNEKVQKTIQKVTGALAILQGIQAVANALNKDSALSIILLSKARATNTATTISEATAAQALTATNLEAAIATQALAVTDEELAVANAQVATAEAANITATATLTTVTEGATVATAGFTAALLLNPITLIVTAIVLAIAAMLKFASATTEAEKALFDMNAELEHQKSLLDINLTALERNAKIQTAYALLRGAKESEITKIESKQFEEQIKAREAYGVKLAKSNIELNRQLQAGEIKNEEFGKQHEENVKEQIANDDALENLRNDIQVKGIAQQGQINKEQIELNQAIISEENSNYNERKQIQGLLLQSIKDIRDEQLKTITNADEKERQQIKNAAADKIQAIKDQIADMREQIKENGQQASLLNQQVGAGEVDPGVAAKRIADLSGQNALYTKAIAKAGQDILAVQKSTDAQLEQQQVETERKKSELRLAVNLAETEAQAESFKKDLDVLEIQHEQQLQQIKNQYKDEAELRDRLLAANETAYGIKVKKLTYENGLKLIDQEGQLNELQLETAGKFAINNVSQQKALQVELLKIRIQGAEARLAALKDDGTNESKLAIAQQRKLIQDLKKELGVATKDSNQYSVFKLFGLDDLNDDQKSALNEFSRIAGEAVASFTDLIVSQYDRQIAAKQKVIDATQSQIDDLEKQLGKEKDLMDGGYANDYANVEAKIALKKKEKDEEIKQQNDLIKKKAAAQKAQLAIDSAAEASGLIVSAVNIFKGFTAAFPVIGVPLAIAAIGLMTGAFVAAKVKAFQAVNDASAQAGASFGEGGFIDGKSHADGGQRYRSVDGKGGVIELEGKEFVVKKAVAQEHGEFLEALNNDRLTDKHLADFLGGMGISLTPSATENALIEMAQRDEAHAASIINIHSPDMEKLEQITEYMAYLVERKKADPVSWETPTHHHVKTGTKTINYTK